MKDNVVGKLSTYPQASVTLRLELDEISARTDLDDD